MAQFSYSQGMFTRKTACGDSVLVPVQELQTANASYEAKRAYKATIDTLTSINKELHGVIDLQADVIRQQKEQLDNNSEVIKWSKAKIELDKKIISKQRRTIIFYQFTTLVGALFTISYLMK